MTLQRLLQGLLVVAVVAVAVLVLLLKPEWWRGEQARPDFSVYLGVQEPREPLLDVFRSYDNEQQVTQQLRSAGLQVTVERMHIEGTRKYPPYKLDTLTVQEYPHLGHTGRLDLDFFNDRLARATFLPAEPRSYLRQLERTGARLRKQEISRWTQESGNLRITSNIVYATSHVGRTLHTQGYVSWEDMRLMAQSRQWYDDYGSKYAISPIRTLGPGSAP
jgi:hypothetical protein